MDEEQPDSLDHRSDRWKAELYRIGAEMEDSRRKGDGSRELSLAATNMQQGRLWLQELQFPYNAPGA